MECPEAAKPGASAQDAALRLALARRGEENRRMLAGFTRARFRALGAARDVYRRGSGPPVLVLPELPGITPQVAHFASRVAEAGFAVAVPDLFGVAGRPFSVPYNLAELGRICIGREFAVLARHRSSPVTAWLRALGRSLHEGHGGAGVGAVGMCLTGNFALALMVEPWMLAPVLSQPSLPVPLTPSHRRALHLGPGELARVKERVAAGARVLALRFSHDVLCPRERFQRLRRELGEGVETLEIDSGPGNPHGLSRFSHSVLAWDLVDEAGHPTRAALDRVLSFLTTQLWQRGPASAGGPGPDRRA